MITEDFVLELLKEKEESDWLDFKRKWKLFDSDGKLNTRERDELIKDILGLANGNSGIVRKTKYLVIGADDKEFDDDGFRKRFPVNYRVPSKSEIIKWINSASTPSVVGIECDFVPVNSVNLYVISIPPTFDLHETVRELKAKGTFSKHTVFMRQDEHTVSASVRDGITIQQQKNLHRQEITNPPAIWFGIIVGALIAIIFWNTGYNAPKNSIELVNLFGNIIVIILGGFLGGEIGWVFREWNSIRYEWRYFPLKKRFKIIIATLMSMGIVALFVALSKFI